MESAGEKFSSFIKQQICGAFVSTAFSNLNVNKNYLQNKITIISLTAVCFLAEVSYAMKRQLLRVINQ